MGVEESDREVVGKYINTWDADVTKRIQSIHDEYKPWNDLGVSIEEAATGVGILQRLFNDPEGTLKELQEIINEMNGDNGNTQPVGGSQTSLPEFEGLSDAGKAYIQGLEQQLNEVKSFVSEQKTTQQQQAEMQEIDNLMRDLHTEHGEFDDEYVLSQLANGFTPQQAMEKWSKFVEKHSSSQHKPAPRNLSGGSVPSQVDASKIKPGKDTKDYVAQILAASQQ